MVGGKLRNWEGELGIRGVELRIREGELREGMR